MFTQWFGNVDNVLVPEEHMLQKYCNGQCGIETHDNYDLLSTLRTLNLDE